jgi:serine/threonine protein kinase/TolB-like protein/Flp pilus assembly protein TadD
LQGQVLSHYEVLDRLGGGGMGIVYKARDLKLHRPVALKFLAPELTRDESAKQRFIQEARAASALDHGSICTIHEIVDTPDGQLFIVMAYYDGETLKRKIERGPLGVDEALDIAIQVSSALVAAHDSRIIHRDIKPANVMITHRGDVKVVDFGLAKLMGQAAITQAGTTLGTLAYMSPEQLRAEDVDERTDIWSTGAVLYEMIAGRPPFAGDLVPAISHGILNAEPRTLRSVRSDVPVELERIALRALAKRPADRQQTAAELLADLRRLRQDSEGKAAMAAQVRPADRIYQFGPFTLDPKEYRLSREDRAIALSPKAIDLLLHLVTRPGALVTKDELMKALWPDVNVTENALTQAISDARRALNDDPASAKYIQTVARRGYRFIAAVQALNRWRDGVPSDDVTRLASAPPSSRAIAVLDFTNVTGDSSVNWLSAGIAETVTNDLGAVPGLRPIDRWRVVQAVKHAGGSLKIVGTDLGVDLAVVGSFQVQAARIRITARLVNPLTGETRADAKVDGSLDDVFALQDRIVHDFSRDLGVAMSRAAEGRIAVRETSNLDAYRAYVQGRLCVESLDRHALADAIQHFERAVAIDPRYALAYAGLAAARAFLYETTRAENRPDASLLAKSLEDARRAIEIDDGLAEAYSTLSFPLVSAGRFDEALAAARRAVELEPSNWMHRFRLGRASWGSERIQALQSAIDLYPEFAFAHYLIAVVHIARDDLDRAEDVLRRGTEVQDRQVGRGGRFPPNGLHWLLGLTRLTRGDVDEALSEFAIEREQSDATQLYSREFAMESLVGSGFAWLKRSDTGQALACFDGALELYPANVRARVGRAMSLRREGDTAAAARELDLVEISLADLRASRRGTEIALATALERVARGRDEEAVEILSRRLRDARRGFGGWIIPVEPLFQSLRSRHDFRNVLDLLADRAR